MLRILSARLAADGGEARVAGHDLCGQADAVRTAVGLVGRTPVVNDLTAEENLLRTPTLRRMPPREGRLRAVELLARLGLSRVAAESATVLSPGQRRRLDLARALAGDPDVVLMDEPTAGLAPEDRRIVRDVVRDLGADGVTVLFTTRSPEEAGRLADRIGVLHRGRLVAEGTQDALLRLIPGGHVRLHFADAAGLAAAAALFRMDTVVRDDTALSLQFPGDGSVCLVRAVLDILEHARVEPRRLTVHSPGLEDVFTALVADASPGGPSTARATLPPDVQPGREPHDGRTVWPEALSVTLAALLLPVTVTALLLSGSVVKVGPTGLAVLLAVLACAVPALSGHRGRTVPRPSLRCDFREARPGPP